MEGGEGIPGLVRRALGGLIMGHELAGRPGNEKLDEPGQGPKLGKVFAELKCGSGFCLAMLGPVCGEELGCHYNEGGE